MTSPVETDDGPIDGVDRDQIVGAMASVLFVSASVGVIREDFTPEEVLVSAGFSAREIAACGAQALRAAGFGAAALVAATGSAAAQTLFDCVVTPAAWGAGILLLLFGALLGLVAGIVVAQRDTPDGPPPDDTPGDVPRIPPYSHP